MKYLFLSMAGLLLMASSVSANDWAQTVSALTQGQGQLDRIFDGPEGMTGIIIGPAPGAVDDGKVLAWGTPSGLLLVGNVYDRNGRNLSEVVRQDRPEWFQAQASAGVAPAAYPGGDKVWDEAETFLPTGRAVSQGQGMRVYVFTEATCGYCQRFYTEIQASPDILQKFEVVWVPVTRDGKDFRTGAILTGDKGILADKNKPVKISQEQEKIVLHNTYFLQDHGGRLSTPSMLVLKNGRAQFLYGVNVQTLKSMSGS